jgi:hypothetical protein
MNTRVLCILAPLLVHCSSGGGSAANGSDASTPQDGATTGSDGSGSSSGAGGDSGSTGDSGPTSGGDAGDAGSGGGFTVGGCPIFAPQYAYNLDVSQVALDAKSATYIAGLKSAAPVIGLDYPGGEIYNLVPQSQPAVPVQTTSWYGFDTSGNFFFMADAGGAMAPIPNGVQFENQGTMNADHHMMVLQQGSCVLYEMYAWNPSSPTTGWEALVQWDLHAADEQIPDPDELGSTTAAGTPLLPGVIWPDEVMAGEIKHAIDIVMPANAIAKCQYVHPASDGAWTATGSFPYGGRLRLKASYDMSKVTGTQAKVVLLALQKYGMFNTDISGETRSSFRLGGLGPNQPWDMADITQLGNLTWDDFDVVDLGTVYTMKGCM